MSISKAIESLRAISTDLVVQIGSPEYDYIIGKYLSKFESDLKPAAFATPRNKEEVASILKAIKPFGNKVPLAITGAGQQPAPGVANVTDGITIHMSRFKGIELSSDKTIVSISPGETWGPVYEVLDGEGLSVSGCRASTGGIGGIATHGGILFFSSERGFIADDVVNYQIVLASGEIVQANANDHPDLYIALKGGGGSNFGIVTRLDFATFKQGKMWGGKLLFFPQSFPGQLDALAEYLNGPNTDPKAQVRINIGYAAEFGGLTPAFENLKDVSGLVYAATNEPYPLSLLEVGRNSLSLDTNSGPLVLLLLYASWADARDDDRVINETKANLSAIVDAAKETDKGSSYIYMNYAYPDQDPISSYGVEQKSKLQEVSKTYDPEGFFQKAFPGGFKLF